MEDSIELKVQIEHEDIIVPEDDIQFGFFSSGREFESLNKKSHQYTPNEKKILQSYEIGSGLPELIGFLNGTRLNRIFGFRNLWAKFFSCIFAVSSGLPLGPEAPMILIGSMIGSSISQFRSKFLKFEPTFFKLLRNPEDQRNFISAGAGAGIASAFGAPVGGMLFAMEEVSSYWTMELSWQVFFCCLVSSFTTDTLNSAFTRLMYNGDFGVLKTNLTILFKVNRGFDINLLALVPCIILGISGGILGSVFNFLNLKIVRLRSTIHNLDFFRKSWKGYISKVAEPCLIFLLYISFTFWAVNLFPPKSFICYTKPYQDIDPNSCENGRNNNDLSDVMTFAYNVSFGSFPNKTKYQEGLYDQGVPLLFTNGEETVRRLFSRGSNDKFDVTTMIIIFLIYFPFTCLSAGTFVSSGIVVPSFVLGGLYGRILGQLVIDNFGSFYGSTHEWIDPGAFALLGAVSFFGGVTRLTISLTIIMVEMTNDIQFLLLIMSTVMIAKWTGDRLTHPLFHALLEVKCIPFLFTPTRVYDPSSLRTLLKLFRPNVNLDLYNVSQVMSSPLVSIKSQETLKKLIEILSSTRHGAYPVSQEGHHIGLISRTDLLAIIKWIKINVPESDNQEFHLSIGLKYSEIESLMEEKFDVKPKDLSHVFNKQVNLLDYVNTSSLKVNDTFSLKRACTLFQSMGLRHLIILDDFGVAIGIITRKDLMGFNIQDKLFPIKEGVGTTRTTKGIENPSYAP
ncbi:CLCN7 [Lepeophtheirus salmonis]|uniref:Chloride channel protein n=1 Tax=Lepeophtheirus salmonis TaxID=72036 RepID=A0A7R8CRW4_LEPSM|nr:CLCN7 [Lepeophtheirus salmonis]CAF2907294.1 CLCN7 [Lepeophtheirus salmonis]